MFGSGIVGEGLIAIHVIGCNIQHYCYRSMEFLDCFQLKTRYLDDRPPVITRAVNQRDQGIAYVASNLNRSTCVTEQVSNQGCRCRFAIASGDSDYTSLQKTRGQLYLPNDLGPRALRIANRNYVGRDARTNNHQLQLIEQPAWGLARQQTNPQFFQLERLNRPLIKRLLVIEGNYGATCCQKSRCGDPAARSSDYQYFLACQFHLTRQTSGGRLSGGSSRRHEQVPIRRYHLGLTDRLLNSY